MIGTQTTATGPAVFEVLWACPYCCANTYVSFDLNPRTFTPLKARKAPVLTSAVPRCRQFIPRDIDQATIDKLVSEPAGGAA